MNYKVPNRSLRVILLVSDSFPSITLTFLSSFIQFQTQVSTLICDLKQLKKVAAIRPRLVTVKNIIYFEDYEEVGDDVKSKLSDLAVLPFREVEQLGKNNPTLPRLPESDNVAVIMYTSGSTGLPKVCLNKTRK